MDGFININKSAGMTSFDVIRKLRKIIRGTKIGHMGTLDPMAEGVLPIAVGFATRVIEYALDDGKVYRAAMTLGGTSDTQDAWGEIKYSQQTIDLSTIDLPAILHEFTGVINQIPPMYSAVHHQGERLYDLARKGIIVEREPRQVQIKALRLLSQAYDLSGRPEVKIEVECSGGTYIRTLCHDIGQRIGTGAYLSALTRTRTGLFAIDSASTLDELIEAKSLGDYLLPMDYPLKQLNQITINSPADLVRIMNGNSINIRQPYETGLVRIYDPEGRLISVAQVKEIENEIIIQPLKVFK